MAACSTRSEPVVLAFLSMPAPSPPRLSWPKGTTSSTSRPLPPTDRLSAALLWSLPSKTLSISSPTPRRVCVWKRWNFPTCSDPVGWSIRCVDTRERRLSKGQKVDWRWKRNTITRSSITAIFSCLGQRLGSSILSQWSYRICSTMKVLGGLRTHKVSELRRCFYFNWGSVVCQGHSILVSFKTGLLCLYSK